MCGSNSGRGFRRSLIEEEYRIKYKPISSGNKNPNAILEIIQSILGNLLQKYNIKETYVDEDNAWIRILSVAAFAIYLP